ncbi:hypothetical protein [Streptomyces sp. SGAir0957]
MEHDLWVRKDAGAGADGADDWHERLGWMFGLIASDPVERAAALARVAAAEGDIGDARHRYNRTWRRRYSLRRPMARRDYLQALGRSLPGGLSDGPTGPAFGSWPGLPYALCYLEWEARYPQEWTRYAKSWGVKERLIRTLAVADLDEMATTKLVELIETVVRRPYRCKDREYVRVARTMDGPDLRNRLVNAARSDDPWARRHAGYVLWLLDRPEVPSTRHVWRTWLASASEEEAPPGVTWGRLDGR